MTVRAADFYFWRMNAITYLLLNCFGAHVARIDGGPICENETVGGEKSLRI